MKRTECACFSAEACHCGSINKHGTNGGRDCLCFSMPNQEPIKDQAQLLTSPERDKQKHIPTDKTSQHHLWCGLAKGKVELEFLTAGLRMCQVCNQQDPDGECLQDKLAGFLITHCRGEQREKLYTRRDGRNLPATCGVGTSSLGP